MAFLRGGNRHDSWLRFCERYTEIVAGTGLPEVLIHSEELFHDLLRDGTAVGRGLSLELTKLSDEQWAQLEQFVKVFFRECESYAPMDLFPAFHREVERRGRDFRF